MSIYGPWVTGTIAINGTSTGEIDLTRDFEQIDIILPTLESGAVHIEVAPTLGGTYQDLGVSYTTVATTGGYSDTWDIGGWQYIKLVSAAAQITTARTFYVRGRRN